MADVNESSAARRAFAAAGAPAAVGEVVKLPMREFSLFSRLDNDDWTCVFILAGLCPEG